MEVTHHETVLMPRTVRNGSVYNPPGGNVIVGAVVGSEWGDQVYGGVDYHCKKNNLLARIIWALNNRDGFFEVFWEKI